MNKEERVKLVFETFSKIAGFEIKPNKEFYIWADGDKIKHRIRSDLTLMRENSKGYYVRSVFTILSILNDGYQLEEIKEPLLTDEEKDFLGHFNFEKLERSGIIIGLYMYDKKGIIVTSIDWNNINYSFGGLQKGKKYTRKELGL